MGKMTLLITVWSVWEIGALLFLIAWGNSPKSVFLFKKRQFSYSCSLDGYFIAHI